MTKALVLALGLACAPKTPVPAPAALALPASGGPTGPESAVGFGLSPPRRPPPPDLVIDAQGQLRAADAPAAGLAPPLGPLMDIELVDADLHGFLRLIGEVSGLNFVVDGDLVARVTVRLRQVAWNHALVAVLQAEGLGLSPLVGGGYRVHQGAQTTP